MCVCGGAQTDARTCLVFRKDGSVRTEVLQDSSLARAIEASRQIARRTQDAVSFEIWQSGSKVTAYQTHGGVTFIAGLAGMGNEAHVR